MIFTVARMVSLGLAVLLAASCARVGGVRQTTPPAGWNWTNSLGMIFVRVPGTSVAFGVFETRVQDYAAFAAAQPGWAGTNWNHAFYHGVTPVSVGPNFPVVNVSWNNAAAFCVWLTGVERKAGRIAATQNYRLPTDAEWSCAVGLAGWETGATPQEKSARLPQVFPWGDFFPPPPGAGNFADTAAKNYFTNWPHIENYTDGFATTAPVGSFAPNRFGLYDLAGNALEWCEDFYDAAHRQKVLRGGAWNNCGPKSLLSSYREHAAPERSSVVTGFRCVLSTNP